jgi:predicted GNAT superfamily acetyltransferase
MTPIEIRDATRDDFLTILALNQVEENLTSPLDIERLELLDQLSSYHKVATANGKTTAFLIAMRENAAYQSDNYDWFSARYPEFVYIDRIVVDAANAGLGIGSSLYENLFNYARNSGIGTVICEYNKEPLNLASQTFHDRFGFREVGTRWVADRNKLVSMQAAGT